jgi:hypothetical protein
LITSYFRITQKSMQDVVTKIIMTQLINETKKNVQKDLISELYKEELFDVGDVVCFLPFFSIPSFSFFYFFLRNFWKRTLLLL